MHPFTPSHRRARRRSSGAVVCGFAVACIASGAWGWSANGTVRSTSGTALAGVVVTVEDSSARLSDTTDAAGVFSIGSGSTTSAAARPAAFSMRREGRDLLIQHPGEGLLECSLVDLAGAVLWTRRLALVQGHARVSLPATRNVSIGVLHIRQGGEVLFQQTVLSSASGWKEMGNPALARAVAAFPTLLFRKPGYRDTSVVMTAESTAGLSIVLRDTGSVPPSGFVEDHRSECTIPAMPAVSALANNAQLTNPFRKMDGTAVTTKAQWTCRREEIGAMIERYIMGEKPRKPEKVSGAFAGGKLTVTVADKGKTASFQVSITKPAGNGPFAAVIGYGGGNLGTSYSSLPVATIDYDHFALASEGSERGKGIFYDLYGSTHSAGELMAWAWGVSRIIDALTVTPAAGIDPRKIAVTGCSRNGKGALVAGAFDQRVALVIPQESGSGGVPAWRLVAASSGAQPISAAAGEQYWMRADFGSNFSKAPGKLPVDHHEMNAMVAPRGLLVLDNSIDWLAPVAAYGSTIAAKEVFAALGATQSVSYSSVGGHTHCTLPGTQNHWVQSYVKQHLLGQAGETAKMEAPTNYTFDRTRWINWATPTLQ